MHHLRLTPSSPAKAGHMTVTGHVMCNTVNGYGLRKIEGNIQRPGFNTEALTSSNTWMGDYDTEEGNQYCYNTQ